MITVHRLTRRYGAFTAVERVGFDVPAGTITGFLGPNGAGKSTVLRMLVGVIDPTAGTATVHGRPVRRAHQPLAARSASGWTRRPSTPDGPRPRCCG